MGSFSRYVRDYTRFIALGMKFISDLLSEKNTVSTTRFVQIIGLFMAFGIACVGIYKGLDLPNLSILCATFIIPHTIAKVIQKKFES